MPRVDPGEFGERELARVFIAATMVEACAAEALLTANDIRYVVHAEPLGRTLFGATRQLAVFYVLPDEADACASWLIAAGLEIGVVKK